MVEEMWQFHITLAAWRRQYGRNDQCTPQSQMSLPGKTPVRELFERAVSADDMAEIGQVQTSLDF